MTYLSIFGPLKYKPKFVQFNFLDFAITVWLLMGFFSFTIFDFEQNHENQIPYMSDYTRICRGAFFLHVRYLNSTSDQFAIDKYIDVKETKIKEYFLLFLIVNM